MLTAYRVQNLRSIKDSGFLEIRPIVVFVGKNSSGKSTLLRMFPLIKQSVSEETREPILWYGKSADFGSFEEAVSKFSNENEIRFEFRFQMVGDSGHEVLYSEGGERLYFRHGSSKSFVSEEPTKVELALAVGKRSQSGVQSEGTYTRSIQLRVYEDTLSLVANEKGEVESLKFNGAPVYSVPNVSFRFVKGRFFPNIVRSPSEKAAPDDPRRHGPFGTEGPYFDTLINSLKPFVHGNTKQQTLDKYANRIMFAPPREFREHLIALARTNKWKLKEKFDSPDMDREVETLRVAAILRHLPRLFREASTQISELGSGVRYLDPVRARASRYYRFQELAIDEIDPQGENVPMFVSSLSYMEQRSLEDWMSSAMGFQVKASREGGHAKLIIREAGSQRDINLADTGFGYSQVLPIILQLWKIERDTRKASPRPRPNPRQQVILAIEQPELHLHPQFQAILADIFALSVNAAKSSPVSLSLAVETHSEHLVNRLGALVEKGTLSKDDIVVYLVDRETSDGASTVQRSTFTESGMLSEPWPFGFFSPNLP